MNNLASHVIHIHPYTHHVEIAEIIQIVTLDFYECAVLRFKDGVCSLKLLDVTFDKQF